MSATETRPVPDPDSDVGGVPGRQAPIATALSADEGSASLPGTPLNDRQAWLERRRQGIGASDVAGILGLSPWQSPWSIWADKVSLTPLDDSATDAQEFGLMAEVMLRQYFEKRTGTKVTGEQSEWHHARHDWMRCTIDGQLDPSFSELVEFKTTIDPPSAWEDGVPVYYECQATWAMAVTGARRVWFGVLHMAFGRPQFRVYQFDRDDAELQFVVDRVTAFWNDHVLTGVPPASDGHPATVDAVNSVWAADPKAPSVEAGEFGRALHAELMDRRAELKDLTGEVDALECALKISLRTATSLVDGVDEKDKPVVLVTWNPQINTGFDVKALRADHPDLAELYTTKSTIRVLRPKPLKGDLTP